MTTGVDVTISDRNFRSYTVRDFGMDSPISNMMPELSDHYGRTIDTLQLVFFGEVVNLNQTLRGIGYYPGAIIFIEFLEYDYDFINVDGFTSLIDDSEEEFNGDEEVETDDDTDVNDDYTDGDLITRGFSHDPLQEILEKGNETRRYPVNISLSQTERHERSEKIAHNAQLIESYLVSPQAIKNLLSSILSEESMRKLNENPEILNTLFARYKKFPHEIIHPSRQTVISPENFILIQRICRGDPVARDILEDTLSHQRSDHMSIYNFLQEFVRNLHGDVPSDASSDGDDEDGNMAFHHDDGEFDDID